MLRSLEQIRQVTSVIISTTPFPGPSRPRESDCFLLSSAPPTQERECRFPVTACRRGALQLAVASGGQLHRHEYSVEIVRCYERIAGTRRASAANATESFVISDILGFDENLIITFPLCGSKKLCWLLKPTAERNSFPGSSLASDQNSLQYPLLGGVVPCSCGCQDCLTGKPGQLQLMSIFGCQA